MKKLLAQFRRKQARNDSGKSISAEPSSSVCAYDYTDIRGDRAAQTWTRVPFPKGAPGSGLHTRQSSAGARGIQYC